MYKSLRRFPSHSPVAGSPSSGIIHTSFTKLKVAFNIFSTFFLSFFITQYWTIQKVPAKKAPSFLESYSTRCLRKRFVVISFFKDFHSLYYLICISVAISPKWKEDSADINIITFFIYCIGTFFGFTFFLYIFLKFCNYSCSNCI
jgi:hypothetical protein